MRVWVTSLVCKCGGSGQEQETENEPEKKDAAKMNPNGTHCMFGGVPSALWAKKKPPRETSDGNQYGANQKKGNGEVM